MGMFWDGFDIYNTTGDDQLWDFVGSGQGYATGRFGVGSCFTQNSNGNPGGTMVLATRGLATTTTTFIHGFALSVISSPSATTTIFGYFDNATTQVELRINSSRQLIISRNGTTLGTTTAALTLNTYYYIEVKIKIDDTTGTYEIMIDGTSALSGTGADTKNTANAYIDRFQFLPGGAANSLGVNIDDMVFQDDATTPSYQGDCRVIALFPNAAGTYTQWTRSTGANSWANVDDLPPNSDTDYNSSTTAGDKDTYNFASFGVTGTIIGVQVSHFARKDDVAVRKIKALVRSGGADYLGGTEFTMTSSYKYYQTRFMVDPATSAAWTSTNLDAAEFGMQTTA
jgi:hypothetical protein